MGATGDALMIRRDRFSQSKSTFWLNEEEEKEEISTKGTARRRMGGVF